MKRPDFPLAMAVLAIACSSPDTALSQIPLQTPAGGMVLFKSSAASRVVEKVRSEAQGVMVDVSVKVGDPVGKGQLLGHLELDATQLQLDLARHAMESKGNVEAARYQAEAWAVAREETEEAVRKREMKESRLSWAAAMEQMYQSNHETQLEAEKTQVIQYEYWKQQYEKRFLRAPVAGIVSEVVVERV
jgi:multidrug efflux pump subunit AcrA (membrane-fusion protein)